MVPVAYALTQLLPEEADRDGALDSVREAVTDAIPGPPPTAEEWARTVRNLLAHSAELERQLAERLSASELDALLADSRRSVEEARAVLQRAHQEDEEESTSTTSTAVRVVHSPAETGDNRGEGGGRPRRSASLSAFPERREVWQGENWVVRLVAGASGKAYRCPGCDHEIAPGVPHVVVWLEEGGIDERRHWHKACWADKDCRTGKLRRPSGHSRRGNM
ncbi:hypothetical protein GCM10010521_34260 [Streptomyces rameus]|uniref:ATP/GTP-binding protein n=1 Tax=Streptomyces rameus TaxID=68261 RepID=A0ABP6NF74_9ACTN